MSKRKTILWLGILVALLPFLGLPSSWKTAIFFVSGILIAWNSFQLNKHRQAKRIKQERKRKEEIISAPISQPSQPVIITPPPAEANQTSPENREIPESHTG
mgnify:FL=1